MFHVEHNRNETASLPRPAWLSGWSARAGRCRRRRARCRQYGPEWSTRARPAPRRDASASAGVVSAPTMADAATFPSLDLPEFAAGSVWLVGAGPGDPGLLSLLALHALQHADSVVYDALVDPRILELARPGARLDYAGKRGGKPSPQQPDITRRLIRLAQAGERVLRLKGGDPFVFGRGGEEALALHAAGVPFRVVPGITAAIGGLAYAGIPATHRDINSAVAFVTGYASDGQVPDGLDWAALAKGAPVLVLYMALKHLDPIA